MINIKRKEDCVGCNACVQKCPKQCISMSTDEQGFLYPKVYVDLCIECGLCERVCPVINQAETREPIAAYAARNNDPEIVKTSSSGGVFHALAKHVIGEGGVVFGARFDEDWQVIHDWTETVEGLKAFQGSKYVQSRIGGCYLQVEKFLKEGRKVLFSGTPCQISGLNNFLIRDYNGLLITVDVACHGVPSPKIWKDFLLNVSEKNGCRFEEIISINFRDKRNGWDNYGMNITYKRKNKVINWYWKLKECIYMQGFLKDFYTRPSCHSCPSKRGKSNSDITIADFWGIKSAYPELYSKNMVSLIFTYNNRILADTEINACIVDTSIAIRSNPALYKSAKPNKYYNQFWKRYPKEGLMALEILTKKCQPSKFTNYLSILKVYISKIIGKSTKKRIKQFIKI